MYTTRRGGREANRHRSLSVLAPRCSVDGPTSENIGPSTDNSAVTDTFDLFE